MGDDERDEGLLTRLNALKPSSVTLKTDRRQAGPGKPTNLDDLATRFQSLNASRSSSHPSTVVDGFHEKADDEDEKTIDELLNDLGPEEQWTLDPDDPKDIRKLIQEAQGLLSEPEKQNGSSCREENVEHMESVKANEFVSQKRESSPSQHNLEETEAEQEKGKSEDDDDEEARVLQQILDEASVDRLQTPSPNTAEEPSEDTDPAASHHSSRDLPSTSNRSPLPPPPPDQSAEMPFFLPSVPLTKPSSKVVKPKSKGRQFTDEEIESWCIICNDNAKVRCIGCDGDLYCSNCWREGHVGSDVGFEEQSHQWVTYKRK